MKRTLLTLSIILLGFFTWAQPGGGQGRPPGNQKMAMPTSEEMIKQATKELTLSTDQVTQWQEIHEKYGVDKKGTRLSQENRQKMDEELAATLTEEQLTKYKEMQKKRQQQRPPRPN